MKEEMIILAEELNTYPLEAFDYIQLLFEKYHDHRMHGYIEFDKNIDENILGQAVKKSFLDLPQIMCRLNKNYWIPINKDKSKEIIKVKYLKITKDTIQDNLNIYNKAEEGPQLSINILRDDNHDVLCIVMNHMLCDGMAFKEYIYLICDLYNSIICNKSLTKRYCKKTRNLNEMLKNINLKNNNIIKPDMSQLTLEVDETRPTFIMTKISRQQFLKIKEYAHASKVTINDIFMTAYFLALSKVFNKEANSIVCAVDLRKYLNNKNNIGLCNFTGNYICKIPKYRSMNFHEVLLNVHKSMNQQKKSNQCLKSIKSLNFIFSKFPFCFSSKIIKRFLENPPIAFTNLGVIEREKLNFHNAEVTDCFITGSMKKAPNFQVAVSTFLDEITVGVNIAVSRADERKIKEFLNCFKENLISI